MLGTLVRPLALACALAALLAPAASEAHLSIIRQGPESRGAIEFGDRHGHAVAVGDFNGDGYDDLAMGAPSEGISGGYTGAGAVVVSFGSATGITHVGGLLLTEGLLGGTDESNADFGYALAAGDFDGDGKDDLAIGAPGATLSGLLLDVGEVHVLRGSAGSGLVPWMILRQTNAGGVNEAGDRFGAALAVGHFNGTAAPAYADLAVGGPGEDAGAGAVFYFMGTASGPTGASGWYKQSSFGQTSLAGDGFGHSLATGNLVGDAADDLAVGVPFKDIGGSDAGRVFLISGLIGGGLQSSAFTYDATDVDYVTSFGNFGLALAAGYLRDANGYESLAIGEPGRGEVESSKSGRVVVFAGRIAGLDPFSEVILRGYQYLGTLQNDDRFGATLAAAHYGVPDAYEDLAIGSPYAKAGGFANTGVVVVATGAAAGPSTASYFRWNQSRLGDIIEGFEDLGASLAFGDFDGSGRGAVAIGAPGEDLHAGQVHVVAPWRQVLDLRCRTSVAYDCTGKMIFSQKPFEQVYPASTTKIMTALLAFERSQLAPSNPNYRSLDALYAVPAWITDSVGGNQVLYPGEVISLRNLLDLCMMLSGNDAAYAIGDILAGNGQPSGIPAYAALMNARAAQLGMTRTNFTNGAGLTFENVGPPPSGVHTTSAEDMAKLARAAMANPLFAALVGTSTRQITRNTGGSPWTCHLSNVINWVVNNPDFPRGNGVKSGSGNTSQWTTVTGAEATPGNEVVATTFYTPRDLSVDIAHKNAIDLLVLGLANCGVTASYTPAPASYYYELRDALSSAGTRTGGLAEYLAGYSGDIVVDVSTGAGAPTTSALVEIRRFSELKLTGGGSEEFGISPMRGHGEIRFQNMGDATAQFGVILDYIPGGSGNYSFTLPPGGIGTIPAYGGPDAIEFHMSIENAAGATGADLSIAENYSFNVNVSPGNGAFSARMPRGPRSSGELIDIQIVGTDPQPGRKLSVVVHENDFVVDVDDPPIADGTSDVPAIRFASAVPNPLRGGSAAARIGFDLAAAGRVGASIVDVRGRRVRSIAAEEFAAGRQALLWDGRDGAGCRVAAGVYLVRLELSDRASAHGRIVLLE